MRPAKDNKNGQNIIGYYGLEFVKHVGRAYITLPSIRNVSGVDMTNIKAAMKRIRVRDHTVLAKRGKREYSVACVAIKDMPAVSKEVGGLDELIGNLMNDYKGLL